MGKADLHAHTCHDAWGDGNQSIEQLFRWVEQETDIDVFGITDHDNADTARAAWRLWESGNYRFGFLPGIEVTNRGGHLLCYFPSGEVFDIPSLRPFWWTVRYAHERGAICVAAHPVYPPWLRTTMLRGLRAGHRLDGVEAVNAGVSAGARQRIQSIAADLDPYVALVGNSDAHHQTAVGAAYTSFPGKTVEDYVQALEDRTTQAVFVRAPQIEAEAKRFTSRRSLTRPGWVRNIWREVRGQTRPVG